MESEWQVFYYPKGGERGIINSKDIRLVLDCSHVPQELQVAFLTRLAEKLNRDSETVSGGES